MTRAIACGLALRAGVMLGDLVLYQTLVVPRLPRWRSVPLHWWVLVESPILVGALLIGWWRASFKQLLLPSAVAALLTASYLAWAAHTGQPGHFKSLANEAPRQFWLETPVALLLGFGCSLA